MKTENKIIKKWLGQGLSIEDCIDLTVEQLKGLNPLNDKFDKILDLQIELRQLRKEFNK